MPASPTVYGPTASSVRYVKHRTLDEDNARVRTYLVGGTASDGDYQLALSYNGVEVGTATFTRESAEDSDGIASGLRAAWDAVPELAAVTAAASGSGASVVITFDGFGDGYTITTSAPGSGTLDLSAMSHTLKEDTEGMYLVDTTAVPATVILPPAANCNNGDHGMELSFIGLGAQDLVLDGSGAETIDGSATATTSDANVGRTVWCSGTAWYTRP